MAVTLSAFPAFVAGRPSRLAVCSVVAIGGGTGLSTLLKRVKRTCTRRVAWAGPTILRSANSRAVVTVSDDGGSQRTSAQRAQHAPAGDIRNCIVALSEDEAMLSRLFQHRFVKGRTRGPQLRQPISGGPDLSDRRFQRSGAAFFGNSAHPGRIYPATASNVELEAYNGRRDPSPGRNQDHGQQAAHPECSSSPRRRQAPAADPGGDRPG